MNKLVRFRPWHQRQITLFSLGLFLLCPAAGRSDEASPKTDDRLNKGRSVEFPQKATEKPVFKTEIAKSVSDDEAKFTGRITWNEDYAVRIYSPVGGRVAKIVADIGQKVSPGDDLALIHSSDYGQALSDYLKGIAALTQTQKTYEREKDLLVHGAAATKDVESAQADFDNARAEKERAEAALQRYGKPTGDFSDLYHVTSPIPGYVVDKKINPGQEVRPDIILGSTTDVVTPLFTIADPSHLWVLLDVPETDLNELKTGQEIELRSPAYPGRIFPGKVVTVGASLDPQTRVARARATVENPDGALKAEMYVSVNVKLAGDGRSYAEVPASAVFYLDGNYYVFVTQAAHPNKYTRREVEVIREQSAGAIVVVQGINVGALVVSEGALEMNELLDNQSSDEAKAPGTAASNQ
jgi:cobalt-zinc-cadmium efflux system membrane fusion protein